MFTYAPLATLAHPSHLRLDDNVVVMYLSFKNFTYALPLKKKKKGLPSLCKLIFPSSNTDVGRAPALSGILSVYSHSQMLSNRDGISSGDKSAGIIMYDNPSKTLA